MPWLFEQDDDFDPDDWKENIDDEKIWQITRPEDAALDDDPD